MGLCITVVLFTVMSAVLVALCHMDAPKLFARVALGIDDREFLQPIAPNRQCDACDALWDVFIGRRGDRVVGCAFVQGSQCRSRDRRKLWLLAASGSCRT